MSLQPTFLTLDEALTIHASRIERYGGSLGIRDVGLLQSALGMPEASFGGEWLHPSIHEMAAAYLFHICKNHPFIDGNKRAALGVAGVFLDLNGWDLVAPDDALFDLVLGIAEGRVSKSAAGVFFAKHTEPSR